MKKLLVKFLKFLLKKLIKPNHYEYNMKKSEMERLREINYIESLLGVYAHIKKPQHDTNYADNIANAYIHTQKSQLSDENIEVSTPYVYYKGNFSVNIKNIPPQLIQSYKFIENGQIEFKIFLGGENDMDVYSELENKKFLHTIEKDKNKENIEISLFSTGGYKNRKITLKDVVIVAINAFEHCDCKSLDLCEAIVIVSYDSKSMELLNNCL